MNENKNAIYHSNEGEEEIPWKDSSQTWDIESYDNKNISEIPTQMYGSPYLINKLVLLCMEFKDIFSRVLTKEPSRLTPLTIELDLDNPDATKWQTPASRAPPRLQSTSKQEETRRQIQMLLDSDLIRPSRATNYGQILLTPKPNNE